MPDTPLEIPPFVTFKIRPALSAVMGWRAPGLPDALAELDAACTLRRIAHEVELETVRAARLLELSRAHSRGQTYLGTSTSQRYSWAEIGAALGISRQSAFERYAKSL